MPMTREAAWAALHDATTSGGVLAQIAQQHPEFADAIRHHPQCYDELRGWLDAYAASAQPTPASAAAAAPGGHAVHGSSQASRPFLANRRNLVIAAAIAGVLVLGGGAWAIAAAAGAPTGPGAGSAPEVSAPKASSTPSDAPLVCPTMAPDSGAGNGSANTAPPTEVAISSATSRADMIQILTSLSPQGAKLATKAGALPAGITRGPDALRATVFTMPDGAKALRTLDRDLAAQCGGHLVVDSDALIAQVPTKTGDRITHTDDTFGACGTSNVRELGWTGAIRVIACGDTALYSFDYGKGSVSTATISRSGDAEGESLASPYLSGDHVVWTQTTEKKQTGLTQPLFTGTLYSVDASLSHVQTTVVFADQPAAATPEFMVMAAGGGFAVVGGRAAGSQFYANSATAPSVLYDVRGDKPKKADTVLPPNVVGLDRTPDFESALVPLWTTTGGKPVYLDLLSGSLTAGYPGDLSYDDGGCQVVSAGKDPAHSGDFSLGDTWTAYYVVAVRGPSGLTTGNVSIRESRSMGMIGFGPSGILYGDDGGLTAVGYDGAKKWNIPGTVAKLNLRLLGRLLMTNASGQTVIVSEETGKEITDPKDEVAALMASIVTETHSTNRDLFTVIQDGDQVILTARGKDGQVALLLERSAACQNATVPGATVPFDQQYPVTP